jgi:hypothetical protein
MQFSSTNLLVGTLFASFVSHVYVDQSDKLSVVFIVV